MEKKEEKKEATAGDGEEAKSNSINGQHFIPTFILFLDCVQ